MTNFEMVKQFHEAFGKPVASSLQIPSEDSKSLRMKLICEELDELDVAMEDNDTVAVADALGDLLYVVYGGGLEWGIDLDKIFEEIHRSNMTKLDNDGQPIIREDGKILKSENFQEPQLERVLQIN